MPSPLVPSKRRAFFRRVAMLLQPTNASSPEEWARKNRVYPASAGIPGPKDPFLTPYMIPIMRAVTDGRYKRVVAVMAAQMAKTESELDLIGHRLDQRPSPILYVGPTKQFVTEQVEPRVMQMLDESASLTSKVARGKRMTKTRKLVAGVPVRLAHGGSSAALKSDSAALAIVDEYDEMLATIKGQGDPLGLVEARGDTYAEFVVMVSSTPSKGAVDVEVDEETGLEFWKPMPQDDIESAIWKLWQSGTMFHWAWQCPHCDEWFIPRFSMLRWAKNASPAEANRTAHMVCKHCGGIIDDGHKKQMNEKGVYVAKGMSIDKDGNVTGVVDENSTISFWVSGLASPFKTFGDRAERFLTAVRLSEQDKIQTAINTGFGELWAPTGGDAPDKTEIAALKTPYHLKDIPDGVVVLTCGVDVQKNRLVYVVRGWGARSTSWLIDYGELWGETDEQEVWTALDDFLDQQYGGLSIRLTLIDSGFRPGKRDSGPQHVVYDFCRLHQRTTRPSKGYDTLSAPVVLSRIEVDASGGRAKYGLELVRVNTDWCKTWVHERCHWPQDQPGAFYIPADVPDQYCIELASEARIKKPSGRAQWVQRTRDNHAFDCEAMAYAAAYLLNVQRIPDGAGVKRNAGSAGSANDAGKTPPPPARRPTLRFNTDLRR